MSANLTEVVKSAFTSLGAAIPGAVRTITYEAVGAQTYNAATGTLENTTTSYPGVSATFTQYSRREREADFQSSRRQTIESGDVKCLIPYKDLPIAPTMEDIVVDNGVRWRIVEHNLDPTGTALHTFQLRRA